MSHLSNLDGRRTLRSLVRFRVCALAVILVAWAQVPREVVAQGNSTKVIKYQPCLSGYAGKVEEIGRLKDTYGEAEKVLQDWSAQNPENMKIPFVKEVEITITPPRLSAPRPPAPNLGNPPRPGGPGVAPRATTIEGGAWLGSETLRGYGRLEFRFLGGNRVQMVDAQDTVTGTWSRYGDTIILNFYNGQCTYYGTVSPTGISGHAVAGKTRFTWSVSR